MERDRDVGAHDRGRGLAGAQVERRRSVHRKDGDAGIGRADGHVDAPADGLAERAAHSRPQEGIDHEPGSLDPVEEESDVVGAWCQETGDAIDPIEPLPVRAGVRGRRLALGREEDDLASRPGRREVPRRDEAIAAVVARPAQDEDRASRPRPALAS